MSTNARKEGEGSDTKRCALPDGWECKRLIDVLLSLENGTRPKGGVDNIEEGVPSIGGEHLNKYGGFIFETMKFIPIEFYENMKRGKIVNGDVLVVKDGATTGKVSLVRDDFPYQQSAVNEHVFICRPNQKHVLPEYLFYNLFSPLGQNKILRSFHGAAQGGINTQFANDYEIPIPPLPTQHRIVSILEKAEDTKRLRAQADELTNRLLQSVFLGMFGDPVRNPKRWEMAKLGELGEWTSGGTPSRIKPEYFQGTIPWFSAGELNDSYLLDSKEQITEEALEVSSAKLFPKGTMLIGMYDSAAFKMGLLLRPASSNQACAAFILKKEKLESLFALQLFRAMKPLFLSRRRGVRQKNLSQSIIKNFEIPLPPLPLQQKFAHVVKKVESMRQSQNQSKQQMEDLFSALMQKAFRGEI